MLNLPAPELGRRNVILRGRACYYHVREFPGPLSIKSVVSGAAVWETHGKRFELSPGSWLVLNAGRRYSITVESRKPVETFCVFFQPGFVEDACRVLATPAGRLLDEPFEMPPAGFFERIEPRDERVAPVLSAMHRAVAAGATGEDWLEPRFLALAGRLASIQREVRERMARLPALRSATRAELFRRLERGRSLLDSSLNTPLKLAEVARAACLSPFHFHRQFTAAFRETPHQYLLRGRLEHAAGLLARTDLPVSAVALESGFGSLGTFSTVFARRFGAPPRLFRQKSKI